MRFGVLTMILIFIVLPIVNLICYTVKNKLNPPIKAGALAGLAIFNWVLVVEILWLIDVINNGDEATCSSLFCSIRWLAKFLKNSGQIFSNLRTNCEWILFCIFLLVVTGVLALDFYVFYQA